MSKLPTDLEILERIYKTYGAQFRDISEAHPNRDHVNYVPIDVRAIAESLRTNPHELFGRIYYHLDQKYRYQKSDGSLVHLFALAVGKNRHCIHFPYLAAILSERRTEHRRNLWSIVLSVLSLIIAVAALAGQFWGQAA